MGLLAAAGAASNWTPASELLAAAGRRAEVEGRDPDPLVLEVCVVGLQVLFGGEDRAAASARARLRFGKKKKLTLV